MRQHIFSTIILFFISGFIVFSQVNADTYEKIKTKYAKENIVQLQNSQHYDINIVDGKLEIICKKTEQYIFIKNNFGQPFEQSVFVSEFIELVDFDAKSYIFEKGKYKKVPVKSYHEKMNTSNSSFYDDVKELAFTFPGISPGTVVELSTTTKIKEPRLLHAIFLNWVFPIQNLDITFECDKGVDLDILTFNLDSSKFALNKKPEKKKDIYSINIQDIDEFVFEKNTPDILYYVPHIIPLIRSYTYNNKTIEILKDNKALYKWYYSFIEQTSDNIETSNLKTLADSITKNCTTEIEKVEALYYWVQKNIKYIAFEYGLGGFIPRKPDKILDNKYGDCKDKACLLHQLAAELNINTYFTWIGTNDIPYSYSEVSSPVSDNHMILTYIDKKNKYHFLDATGEFNSISFPTAFIQGKEAMISLDKDKFTIKPVPVIDTKRNLRNDSVNLQINDKVLVGNAQLSLHGYQYIDAMYRLKSSKEKAKQKFVEGLLNKGNNKFKLEDYSLSPTAPIDSSININYDFTIENYINQLDNSIYVNLNLYRDLLQLKLEKDRKYPVSFEYLTKIKNTYSLKIPDGYKVQSIPEKTLFSRNDFGFSINYELKDGYINYHQEFKINLILLDKPLFSDWQKMISELEKAYKQTILLSKIY